MSITDKEIQAAIWRLGQLGNHDKEYIEWTKKNGTGILRYILRDFVVPKEGEKDE